MDKNPYPAFTEDTPTKYVPFKTFSEYERDHDLVEYRNEEIGFAFVYPQDWGEPRVYSHGEGFGEGFALYFQRIYFDQNDFSLIVSRRDGMCRQGDDYRLRLGNGYTLKDGTYVVMDSCGGGQVVSKEQGFKILQTSNAEAITWMEDCPFSGCEDKFIFAETNLRAPAFVGLGMSMSWSPRVTNGKKPYVYRDNPVAFDDMKELFESVVKTFKVL